MFVLIEKDQFIHLGPMYWNARMFQNYLSRELDITFNVPSSNDTNEPITVSDTLKILPATLVYPDTINHKIEQYSGPYWTVVNNEAIGTYTVANKTEETVSNELRSAIADYRWKKETGGIIVTIQGQQISVSTDRSDRDLFAKALLTMTPTDTRTWKFKEGWLLLTYSDIQMIATAIDTHVSVCFLWEQQKHNEITAALTLADLNNIALTTDVLG